MKQSRRISWKLDDESREIGQLVKITQGRESGQFAVIIKIVDNKFVLLADGDKRKYDRPKKKNIYNVKLLNKNSPEVRESLLETNRVSNGNLRYAVGKIANESGGLNE